MRLKMARRGKNAGNPFWSCSGYPRCKNAEDVRPEDNITPQQIDELKSGGPRERRVSADQVLTQLRMRPRTGTDSIASQHRQLKFQTHHPHSALDVFDSRGSLSGKIQNMSVRNWGLEYHRPGGTILEEQVKVFLSVLEKHLHRGREILLDPELESFILENESPLERLFSNFDLDTFNPTSSIFDSEEERSFWLGLQSRINHLSSKLVPQVFIESLIPEYHATNTRIDFLGRANGGLTVFEIDGAQHADSHQSTIDSTRDKILANAGCNTERISVADIVEASQKLSFDNVSIQTSAANVAHVVHLAIGKAIKLGVLQLKGSPWVVEIIIDHVNELLSEFVSAAAKGALTHLTHLARHLGLASAFPDSVLFTLNGEPVFNYGPILNDETEAEKLYVHFDQIPSGELPEGHLYYREFPTNFAVMMDVTDVTTSEIQPNREISQYFLNYFFRFKDFREGQWEGVERTLCGLDSLVLMPTGHGKSVIYQLASLLRPGTALVIDPIISLMDDQIDNLSTVGITRAIGISSQLDEATKRNLIEQFSHGQFVFTFVAPERLQMVDFRNALRSLTTFTPVSAVIIDEAHCVSEWGHDFRTSYLNLGRNCREFCASKNKTPPLLGLTGTASRSVLKDVKRELEIFDFDAVITPDTFDRKNLRFRVQTCDSKEKSHRLSGILQSLPSNFGMSFEDFYSVSGDQTKSGLIFCPHVGGQYGVAQIASNVDADLGIQTMFYSGKAPKGVGFEGWNDVKRGVAHSFKRNQVPLMVATSAFGMGIDKPNVRYSIHLGIPSSIESFYQEAGRTGRDSKVALCFIIASNDNHKRTAELLSETSSIATVEDIVKNTSYGDSDDILRSLFFHTSSFKGIESEIEEIERVLDAIGDAKEMPDITVKAESDLSRCEKAIHRLVVIGYLKDYTIDYSGKCFDLKLSGATADELRETLLRYVRNYQISRAKALGKMLENASEVTRDFVLYLAEKLLQFIYDTVELGRRRALLEMALLCGKDATDDSVRQRILAYLERSEFDDQLETIVDDVENQALIPLILEEVSSNKHAQTLRGQVVRFLESYPDHPGLLLLRACVEVMCADRDANIVTTSMSNWARSATEKYALPLSSMAESYNYVMDIISAQMPDEAEMASRSILLICEDKEFLRHVLRHARSKVEREQALTALINLALLQLREPVIIIKEKIQ